ncbi:hypothetical protein M8818_002772 [Zalaria obscura]|uniref:Uncharacterized protein n=1 Tax=Zalaria obscura TaxID=2024903 RepID=A0ACC3SHE8_9PEZI
MYVAGPSPDAGYAPPRYGIDPARQAAYIRRLVGLGKPPGFGAQSVGWHGRAGRQSAKSAKAAPNRGGWACFPFRCLTILPLFHASAAWLPWFGSTKAAQSCQFQARQRNHPLDGKCCSSLGSLIARGYQGEASACGPPRLKRDGLPPTETWTFVSQ